MGDTDQLILIHALARRLKASTRELMVYQLFVQQLKQTPDLAAQIEKQLENARNLPELQAAFDESFEGLDEMLPPLLGDALNDQIRQLLEKWNTAGRPN